MTSMTPSAKVKVQILRNITDLLGYAYVHLGDVVVSALDIEHKGRGFKPGRGDGF
jgi:hypothetical protein